MNTGHETTAEWQRLEDLFAEVVELPEDERGAFLDRACAGNARLRAEIEDMLAATGEHAMPDIERRLLHAGVAAAEDPLIGTQVGAYRLTRLLGTGGMGEVYLAERADQEYHQSVAVKIVRPLRRSQNMLHRFRLEREVLAHLEHPNIATLLDGGVTDEGWPYLVMQYVDGEPITDYCDRLKLTVRERMDLFRTVCEAVEYAHVHLIVHRDLKPSNILVTDEGRPVLLDFGIAKLLDPEAVELTVEETQTEARVATPLYAAPEQLTGETVTTATDVYALGLLLYQLLVGRLPYRLTGPTRAELERAVCTMPARRPAAALREDESKSSAPTAPPEEVARLRATTGSQLVRQLKGDVERIALKALRKERERRYSSAGRLGEDVGRYLDGMPVSAHDDSLGYRTRRFVGRHRLAVAAAAVLAVTLLAFSITTAVQARRLERERDRLDAEKRKSEQVAETLVQLFEAGDARTAQADSIPVADFMDRIEAEAEELSGQPDVQARLLQAIGRIYAGRGLPKDALPFLERAWAIQVAVDGGLSEQGAEIFHARAQALNEVEGWKRGRELLAESVERHRALFGERDLRYADALQAFGVVSEPTEGLEILAEVVALRSELEGPRSFGVGMALSDLATSHWYLGHRAAAERFMKQSLEIVEALHGPNHPDTLTVLENFAVLTQDPEEREHRLRDILARREAVLGGDSSQVAGAWNNLGGALAHRGKLEEALDAFTRAHAGFVASLGAGHWQVGNTARNIGRIHQLRGDNESALRWLEEATQSPRDEHGLSDQVGIKAVILARLGRLDEALAEAERGLDMTIAANAPPVDTVLVRNHARVGQVRLARGEPEAGEAAFRASLEAAGPDPETHLAAPVLAEVYVGLGRALAALRRVDEAREILREHLPAYAGWPLADPVEVELARAVLD